MADKIDVRAVEGVLYGIHAALHRIAGDSAPAVMRAAAPEILSEMSKLGVDFSKIQDASELESALRDTMVSAGLCDDLTLYIDGDELRTNITNCAFADLGDHLTAEQIDPVACPFASLTIALAEKSMGKKARLKLLQPVPGGKHGDTEIVIQLS